MLPFIYPVIAIDNTQFPLDWAFFPVPLPGFFLTSRFSLLGQAPILKRV